MGYKKRLSPEDATKLGFKVKEKTDEKRYPHYYINNDLIEKFNLPQSGKREFVETIRKLDKNGEVTSSIEKLQAEPIEIPDNFELIKVSTNPTTGQQWTQHAPKKIEPEINEVDFEAIVKKHITPYQFKPKRKDTGVFLFDRLVYSDVHIGMQPNENGFSLYGGKWDAEEVFKREDLVIQHVLNNQKGSVLVIDELGDFMDGWDGETVRKGHKLPQNMDNEKAYDIGLEFKIRLIDALAPHYSKIICNNICNDNHAGSFGYTVNKAFKVFIEYKYRHVTINNIRRFIDHYTIGKNCFIITHGKDGKNLKFGFKPILDTKQIEKIDNYIKEHKLYDYEIEFSKGDSHQKIFDESTSDTFDYYNYPAFSPSSEWVQTNFKKGMSGFEFFNFKEDGNKIHNPFKFSWKTNREEEIKSYNLVS